MAGKNLAARVGENKSEWKELDPIPIRSWSEPLGVDSICYQILLPILMHDLRHKLQHVAVAQLAAQPAQRRLFLSVERAHPRLRQRCLLIAFLDENRESCYKS